MLFTVEGPDLVGKTTLMAKLDRRVTAVFIGSVPLTHKLFQAFSDVEARDEALWWQLYNSGTTYVCDRHVAISGPVYDRVFGREQKVPWQRWVPYIHVVYLTLPEEELRKRLELRGDEFFDPALYGKLVGEYERHIREFAHTVFDASRPDLVEAVSELVCQMDARMQKLPGSKQRGVESRR